MSDQKLKVERIAKRLSRAGVCSRREAERWIAKGRIAIDGVNISTPATLVTSKTVITIDGKMISEPQRPRLWRYHKPAGILSTNKDPENRPTVFDQMPKNLPRVMLVGRLDLNSEGLLLLTNDGMLARHIELPSTGWVRQYRIRVYGPLDESRLISLSNGIIVNGIRYGSIKANLDSQRGDNSWITVSLQEGKNREIRKVMEHLGLKVNRLIRISFGPFRLGELNRNKVRELDQRAISKHINFDTTDLKRNKIKQTHHKKKSSKQKKTSPQCEKNS